jgi:predicted GIY-YIG superfamily endonuclease
MKMYRTILGLGVGLLAALVVQAQAPAAAPAGTTGKCKDGSYYSGATKQGACRGHKGVKEWYGASSAAPAAAPAEAAATQSSHRSSKKDSAAAAAAAPAASAAMAGGAAPAGATGLCKDGTYYNGATKQGACRGHKGVKDWYGAATAAAAPAAMPAPAAAAPAAAAPAAATAPAATRSAAPAMAAPGGGAGQVWVNTKSKVYHCQGDANYGKTKEGQYMSEAAAKAAGARASRGKACQ